jgi:serine/threonine-protein kinase
MKVLDAAYRENAEVRTRFLSEAMIGARLAHPNIVKVTDTVSSPEVAGIVMELVPGPSLERYIRELTAPLSAPEIRAIFLPVLKAVGLAHSQGIIHRDLKPANIVLMPGSYGFVPKVTDFGIAKVTEAAALIKKKGSTHADARMGTLSYMSPEQIRRAKEVTARSDIFSLGATLYELVTRTVAFDGDSDYEI